MNLTQFTIAALTLLWVAGPLDAQAPLPEIGATQTIGPDTAELQLNPDPTVFPPGPDLFFGESLALSGNTLLVGMTRYHSGRVAWFTRKHGGPWVRTGSLDPSDPAQTHRFGSAVAVERNLALVVSDEGTYVFRRTKAGWTQTQKLIRFGSMAMGGDFVFGTVDNGGVAVFRVDKRGILRRIQTVTADNVAPGASALAVSQNTLVVGAWGYNEEQGSVYIFRRRGQHWVKYQQLVASDGAPGDTFGISVAIAGRRIAIGAPGAQAHGPDCQYARGVVYVFALNRRFWFEEQKVESPDCEAGATGLKFGFGDAVAISRGRLAVQIPAAFSLQSRRAFIYENDGGSFTPVAMTGNHEEESGVALQMSASTLVLGWPFMRGGYSQGFAEIYELGHHVSADATPLPEDH